MTCVNCTQIFSSSTSWHQGTGDNAGRCDRDEPVLVGKAYDVNCDLCNLFQGFRQEALKRLWPGENNDDSDLTLSDETLQNQNVSFDIKLSSDFDEYHGIHIRPRINDFASGFYRELIKAEHISGLLNKNISSTTIAKSSLDCAINWIRSCSDTHETCKTMSGRVISRMPKRLLQVTNNTKSCNKIRLLEPIYATDDYPYATLSHCWGNEKTSQLLENNLKSFISGVDEKTLLKVYQDAVSFTRRAGLSYIWIDSLCIIQDSVGDWLNESARMGGIYQNADLNIAATGFTSGETGLFAERDGRSILPVPITLTEDILINGRAVLTKDDYFITRLSGPGEWSDEVDEGPLNRRAWVVQERILSRKTIHFGTRQLYWECLETEASEVYPYGFPKPMTVNNVKRKAPWLQMLLWNEDNDDYGLQRPYNDPESALGYWHIIMEAYSRGQLTFTSDKMIALSGLANIMTEFIHGRYLAGIWEQSLLHQLVWYVRRPGVSVSDSLRREYRCPSWSWMAVDGPVYLTKNYPFVDDAKLTRGTRVVNAQVQLEDERNPFGRVKTGFLQLQGALRAFKRVPPSPRPGGDKIHGRSDSNVVTVIPDHMYRFNLDPSEDFEPCKSSQEAEHSDLKILLLLPVRTEQFVNGSDVLSGIVLLPTSHDDIDGLQAGEFERVGLFETRDPGLLVDWAGHTSETIPERFYEKDDGQGIYTFKVI